MRLFVIGGRLAAISAALLATLPAPAFAQQPSAANPAPSMAPSMAQSMKTFASSADVTAMIATAKKERKPDQANYGQSILKLAPYNVSLEYRAVLGPASIHEKEAELFYVIDGSATMVTGGKLVKETRTNPDNLSGTGIEGGNSQHVAKGDFVMVPEGTAHWFSTIDGVVVLMTLHLPHSAK